MNLETKLDSRLWDAVKDTYENRDFTGAIKDAIQFLGDLIREKTGLESDGVSLVGQALGGTKPKLKVNKLQTESELNIQKGMEAILRGVYQAIRNPRSHEKFEDSKEQAVAIVLFTNWLVGVVDASRSPFVRKEFLDRVFDPDFAESERYAQLMVSEIPKGQRLDVFWAAYKGKENGNGDKLEYFFDALYSELSDEDKTVVHEGISDELKLTNSDDTIRMIIRIMPSSCWLKYAEVARLRIENKLIGVAGQGSYYAETDHCLGGSLATWAREILPDFTLKDHFLATMAQKLRGDDAEKDYVFKYFFNGLFDLAPFPTSALKYAINEGLCRGDMRFYDHISYIMQFGEDEWQIPFKEAYDSFVEVKPTPDDDDGLPF